MVATKSPAPSRRASPGRNGITSPKPSRSMNTVRNSVPIEAVRAVRGGAAVEAGAGGAGSGGSAVIGLRSRGLGNSGAGDRGHRREAGSPPPGAGGAFLGGAGELILPEHEADRRRMKGQPGAKQRLHDLGLLAQALEQRGDVSGRTALEGETVKPEPEIDARLVRRHEIGPAGGVAGLVPEVLGGPSRVVGLAAIERTFGQ